MVLQNKQPTLKPQRRLTAIKSEMCDLEMILQICCRRYRGSVDDIYKGVDGWKAQ